MSIYVLFLCFYTVGTNNSTSKKCTATFLHAGGIQKYYKKLAVGQLKLLNETVTKITKKTEKIRTFSAHKTIPVVSYRRV